MGDSLKFEAREISKYIGEYFLPDRFKTFFFVKNARFFSKKSFVPLEKNVKIRFNRENRYFTH